MRTSQELLGTTVAGKYVLERVLGEGGIGVVFGGRHVITGLPVAIKLLHADHAQRQNVVARFFREARTLAALDHPNVVRVLDMCEAEEGDICMVMELLKGETLTSRLKRSPLPISEALALLGPVLEALDEAHGKGLVHRDLKPDNIFLAEGREGQVTPKLLDFGLVKASELSDLGLRTATGTVMGTPSFMSPEQARGTREVGPPSDIWSMGVLLYCALTWKHPYPGVHGISMIPALISSDPIPVREADPSIPTRIGIWIDAALRRSPAARPSARELLDGLTEAVERLGGVAPTRPPSAFEEARTALLPPPRPSETEETLTPPTRMMMTEIPLEDMTHLSEAEIPRPEIPTAGLPAHGPTVQLAEEDLEDL